MVWLRFPVCAPLLQFFLTALVHMHWSLHWFFTVAYPSVSIPYIYIWDMHPNPPLRHIYIYKVGQTLEWRIGIHIPQSASPIRHSSVCLTFSVLIVAPAPAPTPAGPAPMVHREHELPTETQPLIRVPIVLNVSSCSQCIHYIILQPYLRSVAIKHSDQGPELLVRMVVPEPGL